MATDKQKRAREIFKTEVLSKSFPKKGPGKPGYKCNKNRTARERRKVAEKSADIAAFTTTNGTEKLTTAGKIEAAKERAALKKLEEDEL